MPKAKKPKKEGEDAPPPPKTHSGWIKPAHMVEMSFDDPELIAEDVQFPLPTATSGVSLPITIESINPEVLKIITGGEVTGVSNWDSASSSEMLEEIQAAKKKLKNESLTMYKAYKEKKPYVHQPSYAPVPYPESEPIVLQMKPDPAKEAEDSFHHKVAESVYEILRAHGVAGVTRMAALDIAREVEKEFPKYAGTKIAEKAASEASKVTAANAYTAKPLPEVVPEIAVYHNEEADFGFHQEYSMSSTPTVSFNSPVELTQVSKVIDKSFNKGPDWIKANLEFELNKGLKEVGRVAISKMHVEVLSGPSKFKYTAKVLSVPVIEFPNHLGMYAHPLKQKSQFFAGYEDYFLSYSEPSYPDPF